MSLVAIRRARVRGFTLIELMIVVAILAILAVVAVPSFIRYMRRAKTTEAIDQLAKVIKGSAIYFQTPHVDKAGTKLPCRFPKSQDVTPAVGTCCSTLGGPDENHDDRCDPEPGLWDTPTWAALSFEIRDEHYFVYSYTSTGELAEAQGTGSAHADLDCDGQRSTFQRTLFGDAGSAKSECSVRTSAAFYIHDETE